MTKRVGQKPTAKTVVFSWTRTEINWCLCAPDRYCTTFKYHFTNY